MKKKLTAVLVILCLICGLLVYRYLDKRHDGISQVPSLENCALIYDTNFGGAYADISIDSFNELGFRFGDSVDMDFSNGYFLHDIPYYNGYYVDEGDPLLVGYPGYPYIKMGFNYGDDMWVVGDFTDDTTVSITLNEAEKYLTVQETRELSYSDEQGDQSDEVFGNYRRVLVGDLGNTLIRSASPCDNQHKRASVVDRLISRSHVNFIINLSDNNEDITEHINKDDFDSPYFLSLYEQEKVIPLGLTASYKTDDFIGKLINGLSVAAENDPPYLVHCVEGKDRTGYVCMLLEALAGASYQEIVDDYMLTYDNYYGITKASDPEKYDLIKEKNIDVMLKYVCGGKDYMNTDLKKAAEDYLRSSGMSDETLKKLEDRLTDKMVSQIPEEKQILFNTVLTYKFRMNYFRFGTGSKTMVILPGLSVQSVMGSAEAVAQEYEAFRDDYTVYVFDRRDDLPLSYTVEDMARDTAEAFKILGLKDIDLFGASQGGMIAMVIAQDHPELVHSLILGSSSCKVTDEQYGTIAEWADFARRKDPVGLYLSFGEKVYPEAVFEQYRDILVDMAGTVTEKELSRFIILAEGTKGFDVSGKMSLIKCPVLSLVSDDDHVLGKEAGELICEVMKDSPLFESYTYSGFGHAVYDTAAPEFQQRMLSFYSRF